MTAGIFETLFRVIHLCNAMHPVPNLNGLKHRACFIIKVITSFPEVRRWYSASGNPLLGQALKRFPLISGAMYWPYINYKWDTHKRLSVIETHFQLLNSTPNILAHAVFRNIEVAEFAEEFPGLKLVLDKAEWFLREGEAVLNLFLNDQRLYSISFTLGNESGKKIMYVGAIQGANIENAQEIYRDITHSLHGMRPRDLLLTSLKMLSNELQIQQIWAISNEFRQHNSSYFGKENREKILISYNEVWQEHGGVEMGNGFYDIPVLVILKPIEEVPSRKRATYRRRYQMLDRISAEIHSACVRNAVPVAPSITPTNQPAQTGMTKVTTP